MIAHSSRAPQKSRWTLIHLLSWQRLPVTGPALASQLYLKVDHTGASWHRKGAASSMGSRARSGEGSSYPHLARILGRCRKAELANPSFKICLAVDHFGAAVRAKLEIARATAGDAHVFQCAAR
jgi:hypothetical protein